MVFRQSAILLKMAMRLHTRQTMNLSMKNLASHISACMELVRTENLNISLTAEPIQKF